MQARKAGVLCTEHVAVPVTNKVGSGTIDMEAGTGFIDESRGRLAAVAGPGVSRDGALWMMRAVIECIEVSAHLLKLCIHPVVDALDIALGIVAPGNTGLIRHDNGEVSMVVDVFDGFLGSFQPDEILRAMQVGDVKVERAIAVEEYGPFGDLIHRFAVPLLQRRRLLISCIHNNRRCRGSRRIL